MLNKVIKVYIPSTIHDKKANKKIQNKWLNQAEITMGKLFGGFTTTKANGGWYSKGLNKIIKEEITLVQSFTDNKGLKKIGVIKKLLKSMAKEMRQEAIALEINGILSLITNK